MLKCEAFTISATIYWETNITDPDPFWACELAYLHLITSTIHALYQFDAADDGDIVNNYKLLYDNL